MSNAKTNTFPAALVQLRSGRSIDDNVAIASRLIRDAAKTGAQYVQTPENTTIMDEDKERLRRVCGPEAGNKAVEAFGALARELKLWLHIGSMPVATPGGKIANRALLFDPTGAIAARYDKIHMFDVDLGGGETYRESASIEPGSSAVVARLPWCGLGLTICYDLRFAALYRSLAQAGAEVLTVPAAFTQPTGEAHWHVLLRARAIETGSFVLAAEQGGTHENGRQTYGHSLVVSPWGEVIAEAGIEPGVIACTIDVGEAEEARRRIPALKHDRAFEQPTPVSGALAPISSRAVA
jgi:deaminated glutathione amidase